MADKKLDSKLNWMSKYTQAHGIDEANSYSFLETEEPDFSGFPSILPMAKHIAAQTIGLDLVSVVPMSPPGIGGITQEEIDEAKESLRDDLMDDLINNTSDVKGDDDRYELSQKEAVSPISSLFYLDYKYKTSEETEKEEAINHIVTSLKQRRR